MTEVTAGPALGPGVAGESALRVCKRPGCGNPVPWSGRGRIRLFCGDACSRRFHNAGTAGRRRGCGVIGAGR